MLNLSYWEIIVNFSHKDLFKFRVASMSMYGDVSLDSCAIEALQTHFILTCVFI